MPPSERERFEAWIFESEGGSRRKDPEACRADWFGRGDDGKYNDWTTQLPWKAWQARASLDSARDDALDRVIELEVDIDPLDAMRANPGMYAQDAIARYVFDRIRALKKIPEPRAGEADDA